LLNSTAIRLPRAQNRLEIRLPSDRAKSRQSSDCKSISLGERGFLPGLKKFTAAVTERQSPIGLTSSWMTEVELSLGGKRYHISATANYVRV
jgi:hypothetical protein